MAIRRGDIAKETVTNKIIEAFGDDFITIQDKKIIIQAKDGNNETVQIAITLTMPKTQVTAGAWSVDASTSAAATPTELSPEDKAKVEALKKMLNIT